MRSQQVTLYEPMGGGWGSIAIPTPLLDGLVINYETSLLYHDHEHCYQLRLETEQLEFPRFTVQLVSLSEHGYLLPCPACTGETLCGPPCLACGVPQVYDPSLFERHHMTFRLSDDCLCNDAAWREANLYSTEA